MNWDELPYNHTWEKTHKSIFDPQSLVTFPQWVAEKIIYNREKYIKNFDKIERGSGWSKFNSGLVRRLVQQCVVMCNYFPHVNEDPLVQLAFKQAIDNSRMMKVGQYRKTRVTKDGKVNITQDEKDAFNTIKTEYDKLNKKRNTFQAFDNKPIHKPTDTVVSVSTLQKQKSGKKSIAALMELEDQNNGQS